MTFPIRIKLNAAALEEHSVKVRILTDHGA